MPYKDPNDPRAREARLRHYYSNKEPYLARAKNHKKKNQRRINEIKSNPCTDCGNVYPYYVMDFDHVGDDKLESVSRMLEMSWGKVEAEIAKCELVCANCHRIRTHNRLQV